MATERFVSQLFMGPNGVHNRARDLLGLSWSLQCELCTQITTFTYFKMTKSLIKKRCWSAAFSIVIEKNKNKDTANVFFCGVKDEIVSPLVGKWYQLVEK